MYKFISFLFYNKKAMEDTGRVSDSKTRFSIERILNIWKDRKIYPDEQIERYRRILHASKPSDGSSSSSPTINVDSKQSVKETSATKTPETPKSSSKDIPIRTPSSQQKKTQSQPESDDLAKKRKMSLDSNKTEVSTTTTATDQPVVKKSASFREEIYRELDEKGVTGITTGTTTTTTSSGSMPDANELILMLQDLEKSASSDAVVRQRIADLPPKVTDLNEIKKLQSKQDALDLVKTVNEAMSLLDSYNARLQQEMVSRRKTALHLAAFIRHQQQEMENDKKLIEEWQKKLKQVMGVKRELETHLESLPDLSSLDAVAELTPLPSAGDLFK